MSGLLVGSDVDICSNALRLIGDQPVTSLTDNSDRARLCNALYNAVRDLVLRAHPWNCAIFRAVLAKNAAGPVFEFKNAFALPTDPYCLRVLYTDADQGSDSDTPWQVEGRNLVSDLGSVKIKYIGRVLDVSTYDPLLVDAITHRLAAKFAYPLTGGKKSWEMFWKQYVEIVQEARAIDGMEGTSPTLGDRTLIDVRG